MRTTKHIDIRIGKTDLDMQIWNIVHQHKGFSTASAYVKQAILEYDRKNQIRPLAIMATEEAIQEHLQEQTKELDAILDIITK